MSGWITAPSQVVVRDPESPYDGQKGWITGWVNENEFAIIAIDGGDEEQEDEIKIWCRPSEFEYALA